MQISTNCNLQGLRSPGMLISRDGGLWKILIVLWLSGLVRAFRCLFGCPVLFNTFQYLLDTFEHFHIFLYILIIFYFFLITFFNVLLYLLYILLFVISCLFCNTTTVFCRCCVVFFCCLATSVDFEISAPELGCN